MQQAGAVQSAADVVAAVHKVQAYLEISPMSVEELIEELKKLPPTAIVVFQNIEDDTSEWWDAEIRYDGGRVEIRAI